MMRETSWLGGRPRRGRQSDEGTMNLVALNSQMTQPTSLSLAMWTTLQETSCGETVGV